MPKTGKRVERTIGYDPHGRPRVWGVGATCEEAGQQAESAAKEYVERRPDTGPLALWSFSEDPVKEIIEHGDFVFDPWPNGTRFLVRNSTLGGRSIIEGKATIRGHVDGEIYRVEFDQEPGQTYERRVEGGDMIVNG